MINIPLCSDPEDNTFDTVDGKLAEAEFFLRHMADAGMDMFAFGCHLSAYLSAARTATHALQRFSHIPGLPAWYEPQKVRLKGPLGKVHARGAQCSCPRHQLVEVRQLVAALRLGLNRFGALVDGGVPLVGVATRRRD